MKNSWKANIDIRSKLFLEKIPQWALAKQLGISESTMTRWLRSELPKEWKQLLFKAIDEIATEKRMEDE